jgi:uncharacterized protein (TIGR03435 family)
LKGLLLMLRFRSFLSGVAICLIVASVFVSRSWAQSAPAPEKATLAFDIVSVKEVQPNPGEISNWNSTGNGFTARTTVENFVQNAWKFVLADQVVGLPGWAKSENFEFVGKMDPDTFANFRKLPSDQQSEQWSRMMQSILTERFQMQAHSETRPMSAYALVIAKGGSRLKPGVPGKYGWGAGPGSITSHSLAMPTLSDLLSSSLGRVVVDRTSLSGVYDVSLTWSPDDQRGQSDNGPSLFTALEEQLGLRLESSRLPVPVLVIDHIEKPSAN